MHTYRQGPETLEIASVAFSESGVVLELMQTIERYHRPLRLHGKRTALYGVALADKIAFHDVERVDLYRAGLLHDIGRLTLPGELLNKDGPLTADEYALVQSHPRAGAELLKPFSFLRIPAILIAHHHERWDGYGYPYGLRGNFIPLGSRILAVADTFDALTSEQPYRPSHDVESALRLLQVVAGSQLDPFLVAQFVQLAPALFDSVASRPGAESIDCVGAGRAPCPGRGASVPPGPPPSSSQQDGLDGLSKKRSVTWGE